MNNGFYIFKHKSRRMEMIQLELEEFEEDGVPKALKQISVIFIIGALFYINKLFNFINFPEWISNIGQGLIPMGILYFFYLKTSMINDIKKLTNEIRRLDKELEDEKDDKLAIKRELRDALASKTM